MKLLKSFIAAFLLSIGFSIQANAQVTIQTPKDVTYKSEKVDIQQSINDKIKRAIWSNDSDIISIIYENEEEKNIINEIITSWEVVYYFGLQKVQKEHAIEINIRKINNVDAYIYEVDTIKALTIGKAIPEVPKKLTKYASEVIQKAQKDRKQYTDFLRFYNYDFKEAKRVEKVNSKDTNVIFDY